MVALAEKWVARNDLLSSRSDTDETSTDTDEGLDALNIGTAVRWQPLPGPTAGDVFRPARYVFVYRATGEPLSSRRSIVVNGDLEGVYSAEDVELGERKVGDSVQSYRMAHHWGVEPST